MTTSDDQYPNSRSPSSRRLKTAIQQIRSATKAGFRSIPSAILGGILYDLVKFFVLKLVWPILLAMLLTLSTCGGATVYELETPKNDSEQMPLVHMASKLQRADFDQISAWSNASLPFEPAVS